jgi:ABC-type uncharacterized transport system substrate-binding protein
MVGYATPSVAALQQETRSIPIVFLSVTDPVGQGLVASLAHPRGNITGFAVFEFSLGTKWMGALKQIAPSLRRVTTIFNPKTAPYYPLYLDTIEKAASSFAVEPIVVEVHDDADIERAISTLSRKPDSGLIAMPDSFNMVHRRTIIALVDRYRLPAMYCFPFFARDGGLISYGPDEAGRATRCLVPIPCGIEPGILWCELGKFRQGSGNNGRRTCQHHVRIGSGRGDRWGPGQASRRSSSRPMPSEVTLTEQHTTLRPSSSS